MQEMRTQDVEASGRFQGELSSNEQENYLKQCKGNPPIYVHVVLLIAENGDMALLEQRTKPYLERRIDKSSSQGKDYGRQPPTYQPLGICTLYNSHLLCVGHTE